MGEPQGDEFIKQKFKHSNKFLNILKKTIVRISKPRKSRKPFPQHSWWWAHRARSPQRSLGRTLLRREGDWVSRWLNARMARGGGGGGRDGAALALPPPCCVSQRRGNLCLLHHLSLTTCNLERGFKGALVLQEIGKFHLCLEGFCVFVGEKKSM